MSSLTSDPALSFGDTRWVSSPSADDGAVYLLPETPDLSNNVTVKHPATSSTVDDINYIAFGIIANIVVGVGIVGNILNLIVLTRPKLKGVMYVYLLGLAVSNLCVCIMAIPALMDIVGAIKSQSYATAFFQAHLLIPLLNSFMAASVYIIICMTVNRYISIYKPTHFQRIHTFKNAYFAIASSFLGGALLHVPLAFETDVVSNEDVGRGGYRPETNDTVSSHHLFRVYLWISEALLRLGPIISLTILNVLIIVRFQRIALKREVLKGGAQQHRNSCAGSQAGPVCPMNAPPSPYSNGGGNCPTSSTVVSSTNGNRLSVTQLQKPGMEATSSADISRAVTPQPSTGGQSPSRLQRGTPNRASSRRRGLHNPEERMLVVVLIAIVILFVVCTTPAAFLSILVTEELKSHVWFAIFRAVANNLELLCFALNFFVYCLCSADIRRAFVDVLFENGLVLYLRRKSFNGGANGGIELTNINSAAALPQNV